MIEFSAEEKAHMVPKLQRYLRQELDVEAGTFDCEFLLDFFSREMGGFYYNRALKDSQALIQLRTESLFDSLEELEQPVSFEKT